MSRSILALAVAGALAGCAQIPTAPTLAVMPAPGKPFDVFQQDNAVCQQYARRQIGANPARVANNQVATGAVAGTVIGAAAGALLGDSGNSAAGGAATGLLLGTAAGAGAAGETGYGLQRRYNIAYAQCMYAKGNQVPGYAAPQYVPPPPPGAPPPPPPNTPPPSQASHNAPAAL